MTVGDLALLRDDVDKLHRVGSGSELQDRIERLERL